METRVGTDDLQDMCVNSTKLAIDSNSLARTSGSLMQADGAIIRLSALWSDEHEHDAFLAYENNLIKTTTFKDKLGNTLGSVTINRDPDTILITSVVEQIGSKTITHTINRDVSGRILSITKVVS